MVMFNVSILYIKHIFMIIPYLIISPTNFRTIYTIALLHAVLV